MDGAIRLAERSCPAARLLKAEAWLYSLASQVEQEEEDLDMIIPAPIAPPGAGEGDPTMANGGPLIGGAGLYNGGGHAWNGPGSKKKQYISFRFAWVIEYLFTDFKVVKLFCNLRLLWLVTEQEQVIGRRKTQPGRFV